VKRRRCEDGKMRRRCEDVRRCEDEKMRRRCEEEKMWVYCGATEDLWKIGFIVFLVFSRFCGLNKIDICEMISACFKEQMLVSIYVVS
jgi:hypothetical protein